MTTAIIRKLIRVQFLVMSERWPHMVSNAGTLKFVGRYVIGVRIRHRMDGS